MGLVTQSDIEGAANALATAHALWLRAGGLAVSEAAVQDARHRAKRNEQAVARLSGWRFCLEQPTIQYYRRIAALRNVTQGLGWPWYVNSLIGASSACAAAMVAMVALTDNVLANFAAAAFVFLVTFVAMAFLCLIPSDGMLKQWLIALTTEREQRLVTLTRAREELSKANHQFRTLGEQYALWQIYEDALARHESLLTKFKSYKNQLKLRDWRSLRGLDFESFLADVFQALGFEVQTTKASGDQGVDLILRTGGYRIAVQAKGYANSVGTAAVQEVYAGMTYYGCQKCLVVTNSFFTRGALDLATRTGCDLIDGEQIPDLIEGILLDVSIFDRHMTATGQ